jgi:hypothetical protein
MPMKPTKPATRRVNFVFPRDLDDAVSRTAAEHGLTPSAFVRGVLGAVAGGAFDVVFDETRTVKTFRKAKGGSSSLSQVERGRPSYSGPDTPKALKAAGLCGEPNAAANAPYQFCHRPASECTAHGAKRPRKRKDS